MWYSPRNIIRASTVFAIHCLPHSEPRMYAIDTHLTYSNGNIHSIQSSLHEDLLNINGWLIVNILTLNMTKTEFMLIGSRQKLNNLPFLRSLKIDHVLIKYSQNLYYAVIYLIPITLGILKPIIIDIASATVGLFCGTTYSDIRGTIDVWCFMQQMTHKCRKIPCFYFFFASSNCIHNESSTYPWSGTNHVILRNWNHVRHPPINSQRLKHSENSQFHKFKLPSFVTNTTPVLRGTAQQLVSMLLRIFVSALNTPIQTFQAVIRVPLLSLAIT